MRHKTLLFIFLIYFNPLFSEKFTVVIDPGHGGSDPGAIGTLAKEKDLNLSVALKVGEKISEKYPDVNVVFTRKTDKTLALKDRPLIANKANGNFFISIHTNSTDSKRACGTETYVIGLAKANANFEVAKRENSVILLEKDRESYQGFDPTSPESYIMFQFMQDQYMDQSLQMADFIQRQFVQKTDRENRGVRQDLFWVLHQTKMPSVLIEMGFVSNPEDQRFLMSKAGQEAISESIVAAFGQYKHEYDKKSTVAMVSDVLEEASPIDGDSKNTKTAPVFKIQLFASKIPVPEKDVTRKGERNLDFYEEHGMYKYTVGGTFDYKEIKALKKKMDEKFPDCFIVAFYKGEKISVQKALSLLK